MGTAGVTQRNVLRAGAIKGASKQHDERRREACFPQTTPLHSVAINVSGPHRNSLAQSSQRRTGSTPNSTPRAPRTG